MGLILILILILLLILLLLFLDESPEFTQFLKLLGGDIQLKNWNKFAGGLDTQSNHIFIILSYIILYYYFTYFFITIILDGSHGETSVYTTFEGLEVMVI